MIIYRVIHRRMKLNLTKPLIVFDLETTGLDLVNDRIIQISFIKVHPDGKEERENIFINPEKPIPAEVTLLTGISDADVADAPTFKQRLRIYQISLLVVTLLDIILIVLMCQCWQKSFCVQVLTLISQSVV